MGELVGELYFWVGEVVVGNMVRTAGVLWSAVMAGAGGLGGIWWLVGVL